jgi:hypothetical protein
MIITMTSIVRPDVFDVTLKFLKKYLLSTEAIKLILNIDNIGFGCSQKDMLKVAKKYFENIDCAMPKTPSFEQACINIWSKVDENYFLHWEDDCQLLQVIDLDWCKSILQKYSDIASLRFDSKSRSINTKSIYDVPCTYVKDGFHVAFDSRKQFGTGPSFIKSSFIKEALPLLDLKKNMEKQFRAGIKISKMRTLLERHKIVWYSSDNPMWSELGESWREKNKLEKVRDGLSLRYEKK